jgi:hypothetical protein
MALVTRLIFIALFIVNQDAIVRGLDLTEEIKSSTLHNDDEEEWMGRKAEMYKHHNIILPEDTPANSFTNESHSRELGIRIHLRGKHFSTKAERQQLRRRRRAARTLPGKKGIAFTLRDRDQPGSWVENLPKVKVLNPYWNYNWGPHRIQEQPNDIEFVPMIWGVSSCENMLAL